MALVKRLFTAVLVLGVVSASQISCSEDSSSTSDDLDGDQDNSLPDGDEDGDEPTDVDGDQTCLSLGCDGGQVCDPEILQCVPCTDDDQCSPSEENPAALSACVEGRCVDLVCPSLHSYQPPSDSVDIAARPADVNLQFDEQNRLNYAGVTVFPLGVWGADPEVFDELRGAGVNLVLPESDCCRLETETDAHIDFLADAGLKKMMGAVPVARPAEQLSSPSIVLLDSLNQRLNKPALSFWIAPAEHEDPDGTLAAKAIEVIENEFSDEDFLRPTVGLVDAIPTSQNLALFDLLWPLATWKDDPQALMDDLTQKLALGNGRPVWVRLPLALGDWASCSNCPPGDYFAEEDLLLWGYTALALGAKGLILDGYEHHELDFSGHSSTAAQAWQAALGVARTLKDRSELWLAEDGSEDLVHVEQASVPVILRSIGKTSIVLAVNPFHEEKQVSFSIGYAQPYCRAVVGENEAMSLSSEQSWTVTVPAQSLLEIQLAESAQDAE